MEATEVNQAKKSIKKRLVKFSVGLFLSFFVLIGSVWIALLLFENEIKQSMIQELNEHLTAEVIIQPENIEVTFFESFPKAGVKFSQAKLLKEITKKKKEIIQIGEIAFRFSLLDLISGKYIVEEIIIKNSICHLETDTNGNNNFDFWKKNSQKVEKISGKKETDLRIRKIEIINTTLNYMNQKENYSLSAHVFENLIIGELSSEKFNAIISGKIELIKYKQEEKEYVKNKTINFKTTAFISEKEWNIKEIDLKLNELDFSVQGLLQGKEKKINCDLKLEGKNLDIQSFLSLLPHQKKSFINDYTSEGKFYAQGQINGNLYPGENVAINLNFGVQDGKIKHRTSGRIFEKINLTGNYLKKNRWQEISIQNLSAEMGKNNLSANVKILDLSDPTLEIKAEVNADIAEILEFFPIDTIQEGSGKIQLKTIISGKLSDFDKNYADRKISAEGIAKMNQLSITMKHSEHAIKIESGEVAIQQNDLQLKEIIMNNRGNILKIDGKLLNLFGWLLKDNEKLFMTGNVSSERVQAEQILAILDNKNQNKRDTDPSAVTNRNSFTLNENIQFNFQINIKELGYEKFNARNVTGKIIMKEGKIYGDSIGFNAFNGQVGFSGIAENKDNLFRVTGTMDISGINIQNMFNQLNNFGQEAIKDKHLRGKCNASIKFSTSFGNDFTPIPEKILCESELRIENGELLDYKPLEALSKYVDISELKRIQFNTLQTQIFIKNKKITLSKTEINNSALNIKISGEQDFDYNLNYRVAILMSELMAKKQGKNKKLEDELKLVENDPENKRTVFLKIEGNFDNMKISYDSKSAKEKIKADFKNEGRNLKAIFREEFGFIRKDSAKKTLFRQEKKSNQRFEIENNKENEMKETEEGDY